MWKSLGLAPGIYEEFGAGSWPSWEEYKSAIMSKFGSGPFDDPLVELMKLKQDGSVALY